ncbi:unnamed protein product [Pylaiella littoralis]
MAPAMRRLASSLALSFVVLNAPPLTGPRAGFGGPLGAAAVDKKKFRKCADTGFCRRNRERTSPPKSPFRVDPESVKNGSDGVTAAVLPGGDGGGSPLSLTVRLYANGVCRLKIDERSPGGAQRWEPPDVFLEDQLERAEYTLLSPGDPSLPPALKELPNDWKGMLAAYGKRACPSTAAPAPGRRASAGSDGASSCDAADAGGGGRYVLSVRYDPFQADLYAGDELAVSANRRGLMHFEQTRAKDGGVAAGTAGKTVDLHGGKKVSDYGEDGLAIYEDGTRETQEEHNRLLEEAAARQGKDESGLGLWEESFDGHPDSKPDGPTSVGMDVYFPGSDHVYGIPEHATSMALKTTTASADGNDDAPSSHFSEPYRLYTLDVFEYELDSPAALYGAIPVMLGHRKGVTAGVFWFNPTETFVDVEQGGSGEGKRARWISEGGALDLVLLPGPTAAEVFRQYAEVTGKPELPPMFSLGFHQCRWNYRDEQDVLAVDAGFEERDFPYDVIWLDIEHTDGKRYFTWDQGLFPDPKRMLDKVAAHGRRTVTIVDPHMKRDPNYAIHKEATAKGLYIKDKDGNDFDGWCWPGQSSYLDFTDEGVRDWWASRFALDKYEGSTLDLYTWNDMNEPSVFNGPEVSMKKDCLSLAGVEHRHWHNTYGMYMQRATAEGLELPRKGNARGGGGGDGRPFVLSRAFFAGSQRWGAVWTGDNAAKWDHLAASAPMLLSMSLAGLPFVGADVGGFFGDPSAELFLRWMQAAAYQPFFRSHAHHDSKRREPWVFGNPWTARIRSVVMARYALLPYWYTLFQEASDTGMPMMRPMWVQYPDDANTFDMDDQWMAGSDLLVKPVVAEGATAADVYFPGQAEDFSGSGTGSLWYDADTLETVEGAGKYRLIEAPIDKIPVFQRGGSIIPRKQRLRRSSLMMAGDPYTLVVAVDEGGTAVGNLYLDDEESHDYRDKEDGGGRATRRFRFEEGVLAGRAAERSGTYRPANTIERVVIAGVDTEPSSVTLQMVEMPAAAEGVVPLDFTYDALARVVTVRKPDVCVVDDFDLRLSFAAVAS